MGFYDYRCMATGVSLKGARTVLVLLSRIGTRYLPITLPITGQYNRLGSIDSIEDDDNTPLILAYFLDKLQAGELVIDEEELGYGQIENLEQLLGLIERNVTLETDTVVLGGRRVCFGLICQAIWDAIVEASARARETNTALFERLFQDVEVAGDIYQGKLSKVSRHLRELAAVQDFLTQRRKPWKPPADAEQHYPDEMIQYLQAARKAFRDCPAVLSGLDAYVQEVGNLLDDS